MHASNILLKVKIALSKRPIRGEYKLWIYQHYAPSINFHLAINAEKIKDQATKMLKKIYD